MELRAEMTAAAEERIISATSQKEADLNVQQIVDRHTKELRVNISTFINIKTFLITPMEENPLFFFNNKYLYCTYALVITLELAVNRPF